MRFISITLALLSIPFFAISDRSDAKADDAVTYVPPKAETSQAFEKFGVWTVEVKTDPFDGKVLCTISAQYAGNHRASVAFFPNQVLFSGFESLKYPRFKIDDGAVDSYDIVSIGTFNERDLYQNWARGRVVVKTDKLLLSKQIAIQLREGGDVKRFDTVGLKDAIEYFDSKKCSRE